MYSNLDLHEVQYKLPTERFFRVYSSEKSHGAAENGAVVLAAFMPKGTIFRVNSPLS